MQTSPIIIAGGGIAGMYCAMKLGEAGHQVLILEASADRWGGRIETEDMDGFIAELRSTGWLHNHARMCFASIWTFTLRLPWQLGAVM